MENYEKKYKAIYQRGNKDYNQNLFIETDKKLYENVGSRYLSKSSNNLDAKLKDLRNAFNQRTNN